MKLRSILIYLFIFIAFNDLQSQETDFNKNYHKAYDHILALRFQKADSILNLESKLNPTNYFVPYLSNYAGFVSLLISQDEQLYEELKANKSSYFDKIDKLSDASPFKRLMLGNMHLQWAINKITFGEYFSAALEFNKAYNLIENNVIEFPDFKLNDLSLGVIKIIIGLVPEQYEWFMNLLSMEGSVEKGKKLLSNFLFVTQNEQEYQQYYAEALFYLGFIEMNIHPDLDKMKQILEDVSLFNDSIILMKFLEVNLSMKLGENEKALETLRKIDMDNSDQFPFYYLAYLHGECLLRSQEWDLSFKKFSLFAENFKGENYKKDAWRKKAWTSFFEDDSITFYNCMNNVIKYGKAKIDIDKEALQEAESGQYPNKTLLLARILFDGGYYSEVLSLLNSTDTSGFSKEEQVNLIYRKARVYDLTNDKTLAKEYYTNTMKTGADLDSYYAANAALKLAGIYEFEGDSLLAKELYSACLQIDYQQYKSSITKRAKEGLKRVSD